MLRSSVYNILIICIFALTGCVKVHSHTAPVKPRIRAVVNVSQTKYRAARDSIMLAMTPKRTLFQRVVSRLQTLGYLPLTNAYIHTSSNKMEYHPFFLWPVPASLQKAANVHPWNLSNPFIRGALIQFERYNGILHKTGISKGNIHANVLAELFSNKVMKAKQHWEWVLVTKAKGTNQPEELHLWQPSGWVWHSKINTGVLGATPDGTWPVYQRLPITTMIGKFPVPISASRYAAGGDVGLFHGHKVFWQSYDDKGIKWVSYFDDGRGIHYYPRARYGFPQSAGCVEEPFNTAPITYKLLRYGVPVAISSAVFGKFENEVKK